MKRLAGLVMALALVVPAVATAQDEDEPYAEVPIVEGDTFVRWWGHQDAARVTLLDSKRMSRASGLGNARPGRRWYMLRLRYSWVQGQPVAGQFDWYPEGGRFRVVRTGTRKRLPVRVVRRGRTVTGWVAWEGPASRAGVTILAPSDEGTMYILSPR